MDLELDNKQRELIECYCDDLNSLEILMFFSRHPQSRFNQTALIHSASHGNIDNRSSLKKLIDKKIIVKTIENGTILYSLNKKEPEYSQICKINQMDQGQRQTLIEQFISKKQF